MENQDSEKSADISEPRLVRYRKCDSIYRNLQHWTLTSNDTVPVPMDEMTRFFEDRIEPAIDAAFRADRDLPWVSYNIMRCQGGGGGRGGDTRVIHITTLDPLRSGWKSFKQAIYAQFKDDAPLPFTIVVAEGSIRYLQA